MDFTPIEMLQITSKRLTSRYEKMLTEYFDYLPMEESFTGQSYPRENHFPQVWL